MPTPFPGNRPGKCEPEPEVANGCIEPTTGRCGIFLIPTLELLAETPKPDSRESQETLATGSFPGFFIRFKYQGFITFDNLFLTI